MDDKKNFPPGIKLSRRNSEVSMKTFPSELKRTNSDNSLMKNHKRRRRSISFGQAFSKEYVIGSETDKMTEEEGEDIDSMPTTPRDDTIALGKYSIGHLENFPSRETHDVSSEDFCDDEALMLHAYLINKKPSILMQIGLEKECRLIRLILSAMTIESHLYAYDVRAKLRSQKHINILNKAHKNELTYKALTMGNIKPKNWDSKNIDFLFLQGIKNLNSSKTLWKRIRPFFSANSFVIIHQPCKKEDDNDELPLVDQFIIWVSDELPRTNPEEDDLWEISDWGIEGRNFYILKFVPPEDYEPEEYDSEDYNSENENYDEDQYEQEEYDRGNYDKEIYSDELLSPTGENKENFDEDFTESSDYSDVEEYND